MIFNGEGPNGPIKHFFPRMVAKALEHSQKLETPSRANLIIDLAAKIALWGQAISLSNSSNSRRIRDWEIVAIMASHASNLRRRPQHHI